MQLLYAFFMFIWMMGTMAAFFCMMEAMAARIVPGFDRDRVPDLLRSSYLWGLVATGCVGVHAMFFTIEFLVNEFSWNEGTYEGWMTHFRTVYTLAPYAAAHVLPTGICWIWWRCIYAPPEKCVLINCDRYRKRDRFRGQSDFHQKMHSPFRSLFVAAAVIAAGAATTFAQEPTSPMPVDNDLPQPISEQDTAELLIHSPFTRNLNLEDSLQLTGVAYVDGKPVATVYNRDTRQSFVVSDQPNASGWTLKDVAPSTDLKTAHVTMMIGPEEIRLAYGNEQITPGAAKKGVPTANMARTDLPTGQMPMVARNGGDNNHLSPSGKIRTSSYLGDNGREMYASLSDKARDKFKEVVRARFEQKPDMTEEQRSAYAQKVFKSIKESDSKTSGNAGSSANNRDNRKPDKRSR